MFQCHRILLREVSKLSPTGLHMSNLCVVINVCCIRTVPEGYRVTVLRDIAFEQITDRQNGVPLTAYIINNLPPEVSLELGYFDTSAYLQTSFESLRVSRDRMLTLLNLPIQRRGRSDILAALAKMRGLEKGVLEIQLFCC